jgi:hypothetical protein
MSRASARPCGAGRSAIALALVVAAGVHIMSSTNDPGLTAVAGLKVGHQTLAARPTGCTVVVAEAGAVAGVDVRGAAPGTRENAPVPVTPGLWRHDKSDLGFTLVVNYFDIRKT